MDGTELKSSTKNISRVCVRKPGPSISTKKKKVKQEAFCMVKTENLFPVALLYVFNKKSSDVVQYTVQNP